jgi:hypothetical protein
MSKRDMYIKNGIILALAYAATCGISYVYSLMNEVSFSYGIVSVFAFLINIFLLRYTLEKINQIEDKKVKNKQITYAILISFFFSLTMIFGYQIKAFGMTESGFKGKGLILFHSMLLSISVFPFFNMLFQWVREKTSKAKESDNKKMWSTKKVFFASWILIFLSWIPVFLAYYPAIMSYDFHRQSQEAMRGFIWFNSHHPLIHTWIIWLFLQIGKELDSLQAGMALFSVFQMIVFSSTLAYSITTIYRLCKRKLAVILVILFYGFFPFVSVFSVATTKDVLFSALFILFVLLFVERMYFSNEKKKKVIDLLWVLEGILMILFRNNAIYAVIVFGIILVIMIPKKEKIRVLLMIVILVVGGHFSFEGVQLAIGTEGRGNPVERYSVIIQQFARVGFYHKDDMDIDTYIDIEKYVDDEYWERYNPPISDTVKGVVGHSGWSENTGELLKTWISVGMKYPNEYIDAFLCLTNGYWFFDDTTWCEVLGSGIGGRMGAIYTYTSTVSEVIPEGIEHETKAPQIEMILEEIVSANAFYKWPVVSNIFKPAFYTWFTFLSLIFLIYTKQKKKFMIGVYPAIYLLTLFLGPVVQTRYILPIMITVPLIIGLWLTKESNGTHREEK